LTTIGVIDGRPAARAIRVLEAVPNGPVLELYGPIAPDGELRQREPVHHPFGRPRRAVLQRKAGVKGVVFPCLPPSVTRTPASTRH